MPGSRLGKEAKGSGVLGQPEVAKQLWRVKSSAR